MIQNLVTQEQLQYLSEEVDTLDIYRASFVALDNTAHYVSSNPFTVLNLNKYKFILIEGSVGDSHGAFTLIVPNTNEVTLRYPITNMSGSTDYYAQARVSVNFTNNTVELIGRTKGWSVNTIGISRIYGICPITNGYSITDGAY